MFERIRQRFAEGRLARRVAFNAGWLAVDRVVRLGFGLVVGIWVARHLGPQDFGRLAFAMSLAGVFAILVDLALEHTVVRGIVQRPDDAGRIIGAALGLRAIGAAIGVAASAVAAAWVRPGDVQLLWMVVLVALSFLPTPFHVLDFWFQAGLDSRIAVIAKFIAFLVVTVIRVGLILASASVVAFAAIPALESTLTAFALLVAAAVSRRPLRAIRFDRARVGELLAATWPLILAGLAATLVARGDQLVIGWLLGDVAVGHYAAATRLTETVQLVFAALASSLLPAIVALRSHQPDRFHSELDRLFALVFGAALAVALVVSLAASWIVVSLYGPAFAPAAPVLRVHVWTVVFSLVGGVVGAYLVAEGLVSIALQRTLAGLAASLALNLLLVPRLGIVGAAWAALAAQAVTLYCLLLPLRTRPIGRLLLAMPLSLLRLLARGGRVGK